MFVAEEREGVAEAFGCGGSGFRVGRQAANIRERKRMLRSEPEHRPPVKM